MRHLLEELFVGVEAAVFAGVVERNVGIGAFFAEVDFAGIEGLGIDVDADRALLEFGKIENLMDRLEGIDVGGMGGVHFVDVGGDEAAGAAVGAGGVMVLDAEVLDFEAADGSGHPTVLVAMIVDAAGLADFPADGHALEDVVFEDEVAGVVAFGPEEIFIERFGTNLVIDDVGLHVFEGKVALSEGGEFFDPVGDGERVGGERFGHGVEEIIARGVRHEREEGGKGDTLSRELT